MTSSFTTIKKGVAPVTPVQAQRTAKLRPALMLAGGEAKDDAVEAEWTSLEGGSGASSRAIAGKGKTLARGRGGSSLPPAIDATPTFRFREYYRISSSMVAQGVTYINLNGAFGGICTVANNSFRPWTSTCRIRSITMWPNGTTASQSGRGIEWGTTQMSKDVVTVAPQPDGITETAPHKYRPPAGTYGRLWQELNSANVAFYVTGQTGDIILVDCDVTLCTAIQLAAITIATGSLGIVYYLPLDGPTNHQISPVGLPTTF